MNGKERMLRTLVPLGAGVAGLAIGAAAERATLGRRRVREVSTFSPEFGAITGEERIVTAHDGVDLTVWTRGPADAPVTVVLAHGYVVDSRCWYYQWRDLSPDYRVVTWDQRSHGVSGHSSDESSTIDVLGRDLHTVIDAVAPSGPLVLVGHSMGGMTVMAFAADRPDVVAERVVGVGLVSTASHDVARRALAPVYLAGAVDSWAPRVQKVLRRQASTIDRGRRWSSDLSYTLTRHLSFRTRVEPEAVLLMEQMVSRTPMEVIAQFLPTLTTHDKRDALAAFARTEAVVICGDEDPLTPIEHSEDIVRTLPHAEFVRVPGVGHMVIMETPDLVTEALDDLVRRGLRGRA